MKRRGKTFALLLALWLCVALLPAGVWAEDVVLSSQKLNVDGREIDCEKYNIDGNNYFKLRDLAVLLNGTASQFSVEYYAEIGMISIVTGEAYTPNGTELQPGADNSATAVPSAQSLMINGRLRGDLSVWNIGNSNFFKLRELGDALGLTVGYVEETQTATVTSAGGGGVLLAEPLDRSAVAPKLNADGTLPRDSVYYQDPLAYFEDIFDEAWGPVATFQFKGKMDQKPIIDKYVALMTGGGYNLDLAWQYDYPYSFVHFYYYAINYTGSGAVTTTREIKEGGDTVSCNIEISIMTREEDNFMSVDIYFPKEMEKIDLGLRYDGNNREPEPAGPSILAGLYQMPDGSFQTSDGRLSTTLNHATVLRDGVKYGCEASFERSTKMDMIWALDFYRDEFIYWGMPVNRVMTGDIYTMTDLRNGALANIRRASSFRNWQRFALGHDTKLIFPRYDEDNIFDALSVRVMYWEPKVLGVYYVYAELYTAPYVIEALIAVDLNVEASSGSTTNTSGNSSSGTPTVERTCTHCAGLGYITCPDCHGKGTVQVTKYEYDAKTKSWNWLNKTENCPNLRCNHGKVECTYCHGTGKT